MAFLEQCQCCHCGVFFGIEAGHYKCLVRDKTSFFCPNGHKQSFTENEADRLRRERDRLQQQVAERDDEITKLAEQSQRADKAVKVATARIRKLQKRAQGGVCPCCNRTFSNMTRHMKTEHPDQDPNVVDLGVEKAKRGK